MFKKFYFLCLILILITPFASIAKPTQTKRLSLTIDMIFQQRNDNGDFDQYQVQNIIQTTSNDRQWNIIPDRITKGTELDVIQPIILLAKITNSDNNKLALNFVVINTSGPKPNIVSAPKMVVLYGQTGQVTINDNSQKMKMTVMASTK